MSERLKIITSGQGPELVLLHGWAMNSGIWGGLVDVLTSEFRVNLVDLPGHGVNRLVPLSRDLNTVTEFILSELPPAIWMGWSLGGLVTLAGGFQQPHKVKKMIMVSATPSFSKQPDWSFGLDISHQQAFADGLENDFEATIDQFGLQTFGVNGIDEALHRLGGPNLTDIIPAMSVLETGLSLLYRNNLLPGLKTCKIPSLFLGGSRDRTIRPESFTQAASLMPNARSHLIRGAGHAPFISHEEAFLDTIRGFLHAGQDKQS